MIRRVSTVFKKSKDDKKSKKSDAESATSSSKNGVKNGSSKEKAPAPIANAADSSDTPVKRADVESVFEKYAPLIHATRGPLPAQSGDGTYQDHDEHSGLFQDLKAIGVKDIATLRDVMKNKLSGELVDDKTMVMERIIQLVSGLPPNSKNRNDLTNSFLDELWNSLPHPPMSYVGDEYNYRSADGSNNNPLVPKLGAAGTPYARSTIPSTQQPGALPDPGLIFDSLFARQKFTPHPNKVSSVFFDWASLVIHDLFQTDHRNPNISNTSSYLDLSILYGDNQEDQNQIRTFKDGKMKPDSFAEPRLLALPPACCVMLVMLNRFHNHAVEQLAAINEGGRFTKPRDGLPAEMAEKAWAKYDNDLFQTGRLIVCGLYINITLYDYLRTIVNLNRSNTTWCLDPRAKMEKSNGKEVTPSALGNQCAAEFNLAYRWHSAISATDENWIESIYHKLFGKKADEVSMPDLLGGLGKWAAELPKDPSKRTFADLKRQEDGTFNDDELVNIMTNAIEDVAGSFGARNVPKALRAVEILGMMQARKWQIGSLNEFRKFFGLKEYDTFEEINPDPEVAEALRNLYEHPDFVELYPGIVSEEAKEPMIPGVGICPTYTISRAVLSDAVALVRGDRFYTTDFHAKSLTNWGYQETAYDLSINQGCMFYKLMLRAFPNHFKHDSIYAHYPMTIPEENKKIMKDLGRENDYSWDRPEYKAPRVELTSYQGAKTVLDNAKDYKVTWGEATGQLFGKGGRNFMLSGDSALHAKQRQVMEEALFQDEWKNKVKAFYEQATVNLLKKNSCKIAKINQVDITRDVGNLANVQFAASLFDLPLKTEDNSRGLYTEQELFMVLATIFTSIYHDIDSPKSYQLRQAARTVAHQLGNVVESNVKSSGGSFLSTIVENFRHQDDTLSDFGSHMIKKLLDEGLGASEVTWSHILPTVSAMVPNQSQVFTQILDFYLSEQGKAHLPEINRLAKDNTPESERKLLHYCMEGIRLNGTLGSYREATTSATVNDGGREVSINDGDKIFVSFVDAARDPTVFPSPDEVKLDRELDSYIHHGEGSNTVLGKEVSMLALTTMLKVVGRLDNLRRAPGPQGELKKITRPDGFHVYLKEDYGGYTIFPSSMKVHYDGELPALPKKSS